MGDDRPEPLGATRFRSSGNYGSGVWDEADSLRQITINVCDECLRAACGRVTLVERSIARDLFTYSPWTPDE
jgi:hypothetical protein